ncbi:MAG: SDR family NAD(P)-dependent oxidoreductase [Clostridia bacterium]
MKLLITGAFGNIGRAILDEACRRGHEVTVLEKDSKLTRKLARKYKRKVSKVLFGDIRHYPTVLEAVSGQEGVVHLAGIIPPYSEKNRELCMDVNLKGTKHVVSAILETGNMASLVFASTVTVTGFTQHLEPPVTRNHPYIRVNNYNESKIEAEKHIRGSELRFYCITRLGAVMPTIAKYSLKSMEYAYEMPYQSRVEIITDRDVATAQLNAVEKLSDGTLESGNIYLLGGGTRCRMIYGDFISRFFKALGLKPPEKSLFTKDASFLDWMDTDEGQCVLAYQKDSSEDFYRTLRNQYKVLLPLIKLFKGLVRHIIVKKSAYYRLKVRPAHAKRKAYSAHKVV